MVLREGKKCKKRLHCNLLYGMMHSTINSVICLSLLALCVEELHCKPLPMPEDNMLICNHSLYGEGWKASVRRRRSADAWAGAERAPEEQPPPAEGPLAPLTMEDVGALFRGRKGQASRRVQQRPLPLARADAAAVGVQDESVVWMPADEQEDCYRQQGIEPPSSFQQVQGGGVQAAAADGWPWSGEQPRAMPATPRPGQRLGERAPARAYEGANDVYSLYSDAQKDSHLQKVVKSEREPSPWRVYKPAGVRPEFPIYDEDVEFEPDPLQGILDERYWLQPETQEAAVRRYVDMAAANMMPPALQVIKRNVNKDPQENNAKAALKDDTGKCPCQEEVACGSCSRGKGKKSNSTGEDSDEGTSYGRSLLWVANGEANDELEETDESAWPENRGDSDVPRYMGRKLLSYDQSEVDDYLEEEKGADRVSKSGTSLLYSEVEDGSYDDDADENNEVVYKREPEGDSDLGKEDGNIIMNKPYFERDEAQGSLKENKNKQRFPDYSMNDSSTLIEPRENVVLESNQILDLSQKADFYKPNKIANMLQKSMQEKAKGTHKTTVNSNKEFQNINDELFANISRYKYTETVEPTTASRRLTFPLDNSNGTDKNVSPSDRARSSGKSQLSQQSKKRSPLESSMSDNSYSDELLGKIPHVEEMAPLFQSENAENPVGGANNNKTNTANVSTVSTVPAQTNATSSIPVTNKSTVVNDTVTLTTPMQVVNLAKNFKKTKPGDEETVDAEVASDIVDTVLAESAKSSVLGHRLGICRRNESLTNVKYGKIVPETEKVVKTVTDCLMDKLKQHLAKQSCLLLETDLLEFLKWMVLQGESYKDYVQKVGEFAYLPTVAPTPDPTCQLPLGGGGGGQEYSDKTCEPDPLPPNPLVVSEKPV